VGGDLVRGVDAGDPGPVLRAGRQGRRPDARRDPHLRGHRLAEASEIATIWRTGLTSQIAILTTFAATLFLPVAAAVGIGVALSLLLQLNT
jgi:hypothetical protein